MLNKIYIYFLIIIWRLYLIQAIESVDELCRDMPNGYRLPHPETCHVYLECRNNNDEIHAMMFNCENDVNFNPTTLKCDSNYFNENCKNLNNNTSTSKNEITTSTTDDTIIDDTTIADTSTITTTTTIATTMNEESTTTNEISSTHDEDSSTTTIEITTTTTTTTQDPKIIICPSQDLEQVLFIQSPVDCTKYFMCYHGNPLPFQCWQGFHWNDNMKKCTPPEIAECNVNNYPYPECPPFGHYFLPHPEKCQYFLYCQNGIRMVQQCGSFDYWDVNDRKCKRKARAVCYSNLKNKKY